MKSITLSFDVPQIEVNGHVFELQKSDADIYEDALAIQAKYRGLDADDTASVLAAVKETAAYVDEILGEGAMRKISGGKPVSMKSALNAMVQIAQAAAESYVTGIQEKYE